MDAKTVVQKAKTSGFYLWLLNWALWRMIPHGMEIAEIGGYKAKTRMPCKRLNFSHIKWLHACGLATLSEYATGLALVNLLDAKEYRLIMQKLEMEYHYQGKMDAFANFEISESWMEEHIYKPLETQGPTLVVCGVKINGKQGNHLTTGKIHWQNKPWNKVKTKLN